MDEEGFGEFLRKGGRSQSAVKRCILYVREFETYIRNHKGSKKLGEASPENLEDFVEWIEKEPKTSAKTHLWALSYYYEYTSDEAMRKLANELRGQRIRKKPFDLKGFRGVNPKHVDKLASTGIRNVKQMLKAGKTRAGRQNLSEKTGIPLEAILEFVKLSDLARIPGIKGIRARLYFDAGVDTIEKMAEWDPKELRETCIEFVERTGFDGIAPLPKEAEFSIKKAKRLPRIVEY
jgi:predicted flap endonuclease-1-like 5' DNA nuclease